MDGGIVKFNALADTDGAGAQYNHFLFIGNDRLVFLFIGGIEVGDIAVKFGSTAVNHLIYRQDSQFAAHIENFSFLHAPLTGNLLVGEAHALGLTQNLFVPRSSL